MSEGKEVAVALTHKQVAERLKAEARPLLLCVMTPEFHKIIRIENAVQACIYEVSFLDQVAKLVESKAQPIITYGHSKHTMEAKVAAERLVGAGYTQVSYMPGGIVEWQEHKLPVVLDADQKLVAASPDPIYHSKDKHPQVFELDEKQSRVGWTGRNWFNKHWGTIKLSSGSITVADGIKDASFVIDMNSIANDDLTDPNWNSMLVHHLKSDDFFNVEKFPTATVKLSSSKHLKGTPAGDVNHHIVADMTLRGVTHPVAFDALVTVLEDGRLHLAAQFDFNRTKWGVLYGSQSFFAFLGKHVVHDNISMELRLFFNKKA